MVFTCKFYHQLYCSTKLRVFQYIFLIIIYFHSLDSKKSLAIVLLLDHREAFYFSLFSFLQSYKSTKILLVA